MLAGPELELSPGAQGAAVIIESLVARSDLPPSEAAPRRRQRICFRRSFSCHRGEQLPLALSPAGSGHERYDINSH